MWNTMISSSSLNMLHNERYNKCSLLDAPSKLGLSEIIKPSFFSIASQGMRFFQSTNKSRTIGYPEVASFLEELNFQQSSDVFHVKKEAMLGHRFGNRIPFYVPSLSQKTPIVKELCNTKMETSLNPFEIIYKMGSELLLNLAHTLAGDKLNSEIVNNNSESLELQTCDMSPDKHTEVLSSEGYESDSKTDQDHPSCLASMLKSAINTLGVEPSNTTSCKSHTNPMDKNISTPAPSDTLTSTMSGIKCASPSPPRANMPRKKRKSKRKPLCKAQDTVKPKNRQAHELFNEPFETLRVGGARKARRKRQNRTCPKAVCDYSLNLGRPSSSGCQRLYGTTEVLSDSDEEYVQDCNGWTVSECSPTQSDFEIVFDGIQEINFYSEADTVCLNQEISFIMSGNDDIFDDDSESVCSSLTDETYSDDEWQQMFKQNFESFQDCLFASDLDEAISQSKEAAEDEELCDEEFSVLISTVEEKSLRDYEAEQILREVNQRWRDEMEGVQTKEQSIKVHFAPDESLAEVREFEKCIEEHDENDWFMYKLMRCRFAKRVSELEPIISPCLDKYHRENIFKTIYS